MTPPIDSDSFPDFIGRQLTQRGAVYRSGMITEVGTTTLEVTMSGTEPIVVPIMTGIGSAALGDTVVMLEQGNQLMVLGILGKTIDSDGSGGGGGAASNEVWINAEPPTDSAVEIWIDPDGEPTDYLDQRYVLKTGDTMEGPLVLSADPVNGQEAATKQYVDSMSGGGGGASFYEHTQSMLATDWVVVHNLGRMPSVSCRDAVENVVHGSVQHNSDIQLTVHFATSCTGKAYCT